MSVAYSDVEQMILERWTDVMGLFDAHRSMQDRLEAQLQVVSDRIARWARPMSFDIDCQLRDAEVNAWRQGWADRRKEPRVLLTLGGLCPIGFRKVDAAHPYLWVSTYNLADYKIKEPERIALAHSLRTALGEKARE